MGESVPVWLAVVVVGCIVAEWGITRYRGRSTYERGETLATLGVWLGARLSRVLAIPFAAWVTDGLRIWGLPDLPTTPLVFIAAVVLMDFVYYWHHRLSHEVGLLWAVHQTHHSAQRLNLLASARLSWLGPWVVQPLLVAPLVLLGVPTTVVIGVLALDLIFQFFLHTELVPRLPMLEGWLNTPAAHRVHHARNPSCLDVNYSGIFVVWDRLFGTWRTPDIPTEQLEYGLTTGPQGHNPVWLVFGGLVRWARGERI